MTYKWLAATVILFSLTGSIGAQRSDAQARQELQQAQNDVPQLIRILGLRPGMSVADIGAGFGAMVQVLATTLGPTSRVYATDIAATSLDMLKQMVTNDKLPNVPVVEGGIDSTNLPNACCDGIYMRDVYHHFTKPDAMNKSLFTALKSGGRLAIIDFEAKPGSPLPDGVPTNRAGHGIPPTVLVAEVTAAGFVHDRTIASWPDPDGGYFLELFRKP